MSQRHMDNTISRCSSHVMWLLFCIRVFAAPQVGQWRLRTRCKAPSACCYHEADNSSNVLAGSKCIVCTYGARAIAEAAYGIELCQHTSSAGQYCCWTKSASCRMRFASHSLFQRAISASSNSTQVPSLYTAFTTYYKLVCQAPDALGI